MAFTPIFNKTRKKFVQPALEWIFKIGIAIAVSWGFYALILKFLMAEFIYATPLVRLADKIGSYFIVTMLGSLSGIPYFLLTIPLVFLNKLLANVLSYPITFIITLPFALISGIQWLVKGNNTSSTEKKNTLSLSEERLHSLNQSLETSFLEIKGTEEEGYFLDGHLPEDTSNMVDRIASDVADSEGGYTLWGLSSAIVSLGLMSIFPMVQLSTTLSTGAGLALIFGSTMALIPWSVALGLYTAYYFTVLRPKNEIKSQLDTLINEAKEKLASEISPEPQEPASSPTPQATLQFGQFERYTPPTGIQSVYGAELWDELEEMAAGYKL